MSKVKKEVIEAAVLKLLSDITMTMPTPTYKFLLGSISALATMNNGQKIHEILGLVADNEGYIDLSMLKTLINGGFDASGGKISMDLFKNQNSLMAMLVKPLTLTITKEDIQKILNEVEQQAIQDVTLHQSQQPAQNATPQSTIPQVSST